MSYVTMRRRLGGVLAVAALLATLVAPARAAGPTITSGSIRSFDGTKIVYTLFVPAGATASSPVPVILRTHGWGGTGETAYSGYVKTLVDNGYAVLTWDQRGFGRSGGEANVDSQDYEVKDVQALIDFVAAQPGIRLDAPGDPRMGMSGGSYAGGIQLMVASADHRVDAIAPEIPWNDLLRSLRPNGVLKMGWDLVLYGAGFATASANGLPAGETGAYAPQIHQSFVEGMALNDWSAETVAWFDARSPKHYINGDGIRAGITAPTLIMEGTVDTLFTINEGVDNYLQVKANGVPAKLVLFCGGHGVCTYPGGPAGKSNGEFALRWYDRYVKGDTSVNTGPEIEYQMQDGSWGSAPSWPVTAAMDTTSISGAIASGPVPGTGAAIAAMAQPGALTFPLDLGSATEMVGVPKLTLDVTGVGTEASLFFKLLDVGPDGIPQVVDNQVEALRLRNLSLDQAQRIEIDLVGVSWKLRPGHRILLEVSQTTNTHAFSRVPAVVLFEGAVSVPVS